jgi:arylsulfatase A-like enzyme
LLQIHSAFCRIQACPSDAHHAKTGARRSATFREADPSDDEIGEMTITLRRVRAAHAVAGLFALLCATSACNGARPSPPTTSRANVILISVDTLRADRLGSYGYDRPTSPAIDRLASRGVRFANAIAESSWTLPSHMSLMTGLHPTTHGLTAYKGQALSEQTPLLAQVVRTAGYRCFAFTGGGFVSDTWGFGRGFEQYEEDLGKPLDAVLASAKERIAAVPPDARYFLFLHTYAVHSPYDPPERYALMFRTRSEGDYLSTKLQPDMLNRMKLTSGQVQFVSDQYDADIRAADDHLGDFFSWLEQRDAFRDTIVILLSDHGEELGEHGLIGHGSTLYIEVLRIPLILVAPGITPRVVREPVGLMDVMPTVLDMLGVASPPMEGRSLAPLLRAEATGDEERPRFSELTGKLRSVVSGTYHLISDPNGASRQLFDLRRDPMERQSLPMTGEGEKLDKVLRAHLADLAPPKAPGRAVISAAVQERLRALGFLEV